MTATFAGDDALSVTEDSGDGRASWALNIHEIGVGALNKSVELVLSLFVFEGRVQEVVVHGMRGQKTFKINF